MFDNPTVNIFIGFSLIFLLYSLLATTLQEIVAKWFGLRNRMLLKAIRRMLNDETSIAWVKRIKLVAFLREMLIGLIRLLLPYFLDKRSFVKAFFDAPDIKYLGESTLNSKPSYIEPATFSQTVVNLLRGNDVSPSSNQMELIRSRLYTTGVTKPLPASRRAAYPHRKPGHRKENPSDDQTIVPRIKDILMGLLDAISFNTPGSIHGPDFIIKKETLATLRYYYVDAGGDIEKFKLQLEQWFEETMRRATGWYKKQTTVLLFLIGFSMANYYNVDAVHIYSILSKDKATQGKLVDMAVRDKDQLGKLTADLPLSKQHKAVPPANVNKQTLLEANYKALQKDANETNQLMGIGHQDGQSIWNIGFFITGLAISLGANFWFDVLSKLVSLRAAGPKPAPANIGSKNQNTVKTVG